MAHTNNKNYLTTKISQSTVVLSNCIIIRAYTLHATKYYLLSHRDIGKAIVDCEYYLMYLNTLQPWFLRLNQAFSPDSIMKLFPPTIKTLLLVWQHSRYQSEVFTCCWCNISMHTIIVITRCVWLSWACIVNKCIAVASIALWKALHNVMSIEFSVMSNVPTRLVIKFVNDNADLRMSWTMGNCGYLSRF